MLTGCGGALVTGNTKASSPPSLRRNKGLNKLKMKLKPKVFVEAAESVDSGLNWFACNALERVLNHTGYERYQTFFRDHFLTHAYDPETGIEENGGLVFGPILCTKNREHRILALLLCAAILEAEGKK